MSAVNRGRLRTATTFTLVGLAMLGACDAAGPSGEPLVLAERGASNPTVAIDPRSGATFVAWVGTEDGTSDVWLVRVGPDGDVAPPVRVNDIEGDAAPHLQAPAQVAAGPGGAVYVAWTNATLIEGRRFPASDLRFARSLDGGRSFEPTLTVNDDAGGAPSSHTFHDVLVTDDGTVVVSWLDGRRGEEGAAAGEESGAGGHAGHTRGATLGPDVRIAVSTDRGASFGPNRIANRQTCPCCRTALAASPDGGLYVAWREIFEGDVRDVVVARSADLGTTWSQARRVAADDWVFPGCPHAGPSMALEPDGTLHVAWYTGKPEAPGLYRTRSDDGGATFSGVVPLLTDAWVPPSQVEIGVDSDGTLHAVWEDRRAEPVLLYARGELSGTVSAEGSDPALAVVGDRMALAWLDGERVLVRTGRTGG
jgi:hypothetical protein